MTWDWTQISWTIGEHSTHWANIPRSNLTRSGTTCLGPIYLSNLFKDYSYLIRTTWNNDIKKQQQK